MSLSGRIAFITGAGSGIGRATCKILARDGANIVAADLNETNARQTIDLIDKPETQNLSIGIEVSNSSSVKSALDKVLETYKKPPSIIVNCAGITRDNFLLKLSEANFQEVIDVNLKTTRGRALPIAHQAVSLGMKRALVACTSMTQSALKSCGEDFMLQLSITFYWRQVIISDWFPEGTFLVVQTFTNAIIEHQITQASIINIGSIVGERGNIGQANYCASKAGVELLTKTAAKELGVHGIRVNVVLPGFIATPMTDIVPEKVKAFVLKQIPLARLGTPEEIAEVISFLASDKSSYINGASINVTGGMN